MNAMPPPRAAVAPDQDQFLTVLSRDEAKARWDAALPEPAPGVETVPLAAALGRVVAWRISSPMDVPPFDRSLVDGFAVRAADTAGAGEAEPVALALTGETIACGTAPRLAVPEHGATVIATGGPIPRGADAVVMVEHTTPGPNGTVLVKRPAAPGQGIGFAGGDLARGEVLLRRGIVITSREVGMLAAAGVAELAVCRKPRVAVLSTGDELVAPGKPLGPAQIYDSNGPIVAAAVAENGGEPVSFGVTGDDEAALTAALAEAHRTCDMVILSGGTSKSAGDLTYRVVARLGRPGIVAHGVALKPGKPLCLVVADGKPVVVLPGFPTSAMFTFHDFVVPVLRRMAGLPPRVEDHVDATVPVRVPSDLGRTEFVMAALTRGPDGLVAFPTSKGSGAVTSFSQADGFFAVDALADHVPAGAGVSVTLIGRQALPDLTIIGSHCVGLDAVLDILAGQGISARSVSVGSLGGLGAVARGECDLAGVHLLDAATGVYNRPFLAAGLDLVPGWRRMQGVLFRPGDARFEGATAQEAAARALADPACILVGRNQGAGTRILLDGLLAGARPPGYWNQPRSHNAAAAAIAQGRADWGLAIEPVARDYGLGFLPLSEEHYDFAVAAARRDQPGVRAFLAALDAPSVLAALSALGFARAKD
ncbi:molybdopterin biosynthesis protein [Alsobacter sp. R-9]